MSFKSFIYYCALCGGWAAFIVWAIQQFAGVQNRSETAIAVTVGSLLGLMLAFVVGLLDALLNSTSYSRYIRVLICVAVGFLGSLLVSFIAQKLYEKSNYLTIFLIIGWTIVGAIIGASLGVFDVLRAVTTGDGMKQALRKVINGVIGGSIGGALGGFLNGFVKTVPWLLPWPAAAETVKDALPRSTLAIGLVILGMCIGLLIGLAQVILKEAWVRVEQGFRAGREMILSKPDTTVGRAESCDIGLFGDNKVEKMHSRIVLKGGRYMIVDVNTPEGTFLNGQRITGPTPLSSGDTIGVGRNVLRFEERAKRK